MSSRNLGRKCGGPGTSFKGQPNIKPAHHLTIAVRFWVANPNYNYRYLFTLQDGSVPIVFSSKEATDESMRPVLTIRYQTKDQKIILKNDQ